MIISRSKKVHLIFPLNLFLTEYFFFQNKFFKLQYIFLQLIIRSFLKAIRNITFSYLITLKLFKRIKKSNVITKNNLSGSTKKLWRQKGLGKARVGSVKSPLWRGGSILFGPISRILSFKLQTKKKKISFFYILLNKRTYISFVFLTPTMYTFSNIRERLCQQRRLKGLFSKKLIYVVLNNNGKHVSKSYSFMYINALNIIYFLKFDYIIFII